MPRKLPPSSPSRTKKPRGPVFTGRQRKFVEEYLVDYNELAAAHRAGFSKSNKAAGWRTLRKAHVQAAIQARLKDVYTRLAIDADDVRQVFIQIAFDARTFANGGPTRVERMMAADRLAKMFGLYKVERPGEVGKTLEQLLNEAGAVETQLGPALPPPRLRLIEGGRS